MLKAHQYYQIYDCYNKHINTNKVSDDARGEEESRPEDPKLELKFWVQKHRPANVMVVGHSFVKRLSNFLNITFGFYNNLNMDYNICNVSWIARGGMKVIDMYNNHLHEIADLNIDVVFVDIGCNDLCDMESSTF